MNIKWIWNVDSHATWHFWGWNTWCQMQLKVIGAVTHKFWSVWIDLFCSRAHYFLFNLGCSNVEEIIFSALFLSYQLQLLCRVPCDFWCTFSDKGMNSWWCGNNASNEWINVVHLIPQFVWLRALTVMGFWFLLITMSIWDHKQNWFLQMSWYSQSHHENALLTKVATMLTGTVGP